jgi:hypothetical protein
MTDITDTQLWDKPGDWNHEGILSNHKARGHVWAEGEPEECWKLHVGFSVAYMID